MSAQSPGELTPLRFHREGEGWHLHPKRAGCFLVAGVVLFSVFALMAAMQWNRSPWLTALLLGVGLVFGAIPFVVRRDRRRSPARLIQYDARPATLVPVNAFSVAGVAIFALLGILMLGGAGVLAYAAFTEGTWSNLVGTVLLGAIGLLFAAGAVGAVSQRGRADLGIVVDADGVTLTDRKVPTRVAWDDVQQVRDHWRRGVWSGLPTPDDQVHNWLTFELHHEPEVADPATLSSGTKHPSVNAGSLGVDPYAALGFLRFYLDHPERRHELGGSDSLARLSPPPGAVPAS